MQRWAPDDQAACSHNSCCPTAPRRKTGRGLEVSRGKGSLTQIPKGQCTSAYAIDTQVYAYAIDTQVYAYAIDTRVYAYAIDTRVYAYAIDT